jgi:hypothetical protein
MAKRASQIASRKKNGAGAMFGVIKKCKLLYTVNVHIGASFWDIIPQDAEKSNFFIDTRLSLM